LAYCIIYKEMEITMNKNNLKISVGIPAFNEEANIKNVLEELLMQKETGFILKEILVVSDGSTDTTVEKVKEVRDKRIRIIKQPIRQGKSAAIDKILKNFDADFLILADADIHLADRQILEKFVTQTDFTKVGIVAPKFLPFKGRTIFEKALFYSVEMQNEIKAKWNDGNNYLSAKGCFLGLSRTFAKSVSMPTGLTNDDAFLFFKARALGLSTRYIENAVVFYKLPATFADHVFQSSRFQISHHELKNFFGKNLKKEYKIPAHISMFYFLKYFLMNPYTFILYFAIYALAKIKRQKNITATWHMVRSTKRITKAETMEVQINHSQKMKILMGLRKLIYVSLYMLDRFLLKKKPHLVIFCYHSINNDKWRFSLDYQTLVQQIEYLKTQQYEFIRLKDIANYITGKKPIDKPSVIITFDDGYKDLLTTIAYFKKNGIKPTLFLLSDTKNADRVELATNRPFLNMSQIRMLMKNGWIMGCHSGTHRDLSALDGKVLEREITDAKKQLETVLKTKLDYFAYPKGRYNQRVIDVVKKAQFDLGLSMDDGFISQNSNAYTLPRVGIDRTHTHVEFKAAFSPSVIRFRSFIKHKMGITI